MTDSVKNMTFPGTLCRWPDPAVLLCHATLFENNYSNAFTRFVNKHPELLKIYFEQWLCGLETAKHYMQTFHLIISDRNEDDILAEFFNQSPILREKWKLHRFPLYLFNPFKVKLLKARDQMHIPDAFGFYDASRLCQFLETENIHSFVMLNFTSHFLIPGYIFENMLEVLPPEEAHVIRHHPKSPPIWISTSSIFTHIYYEVKSEHNQVLDSQFNRQIERLAKVTQADNQNIAHYKSRFMNDKKIPVTLYQLIKKASQTSKFYSQWMSTPTMALTYLINACHEFKPLPEFLIHQSIETHASPETETEHQWQAYLKSLTETQTMPIVMDITDSAQNSLNVDKFDFYLRENRIKPSWIQLGIFHDPLKHPKLSSIASMLQNLNVHPLGALIPLRKQYLSPEIEFLNSLDFIILNLDPLFEHIHITHPCDPSVLQTISTVIGSMPSKPKLYLRLSFRFQHIELIEYLFARFQLEVSDLHVRPHTNGSHSIMFRGQHKEPVKVTGCQHSKHMIFLNCQLGHLPCDAPDAVNEIKPHYLSTADLRGNLAICESCHWRNWENHNYESTIYVRQSLKFLNKEKSSSELLLRHTFDLQKIRPENNYSLQFYQACIRECYFKKDYILMLKWLEIVLKQNPHEEPFRAFLNIL